MSEFSGKTTWMWGVIRPDGSAAMSPPDGLSLGAAWTREASLYIAGYATTDLNDDSYERSKAFRVANALEQALVELGVDPEQATHKVVLFTVITTVKTIEATA